MQFCEKILNFLRISVVGANYNAYGTLFFSIPIHHIGVIKDYIFIIPPANEVYSDPYVRPFIRPSVPPNL